MDESTEQLMILLKLSAAPFGTPEEREYLFALEDTIAEAIADAGAGEYDGNEIGQGEFSFVMYGPSARRMLEVARPIIPPRIILPGSYAVLRSGADDETEVRVELAPGPPHGRDAADARRER